MGRLGLDRPYKGYGQVVGPGEGGDKPSGCIQCEEPVDYLRNDCLLEKDSAS